MTTTKKIPTIKIAPTAISALSRMQMSDDRLVDIMNGNDNLSWATRTQQRWMAAQILGQRYKLEVGHDSNSNRYDNDED